MRIVPTAVRDADSSSYVTLDSQSPVFTLQKSYCGCLREFSRVELTIVSFEAGASPVLLPWSSHRSEAQRNEVAGGTSFLQSFAVQPAVPATLHQASQPESRIISFPAQCGKHAFPVRYGMVSSREARLFP